MDPTGNRPVRDVELRDLPRLSATTPMYDLLNLFESGRSHMAVLTRPPVARTLESTRGPGSGESCGGGVQVICAGRVRVV